MQITRFIFQGLSLCLGALGLGACHLLLPEGPVPSTPAAIQNPPVDMRVAGSVSDPLDWTGGSKVAGRMGHIELFGRAGVLASPEGQVQAATGLPLARPTRLLWTEVPNSDYGNPSLVIAVERQEAWIGATNDPGSENSTLLTERTLWGSLRKVAESGGADPRTVSTTDLLDALDTAGTTGQPVARVATVDHVGRNLGPLDPSTVANEPWLAEALLEGGDAHVDSRFYGSYVGGPWSLTVQIGGEELLVEIDSVELHLRHVGAEVPEAAGGLWGEGLGVLGNACDLIDHGDCDEPRFKHLRMSIAGEVVAYGWARLLLTGYSEGFAVDWNGTLLPQPLPLLANARLAANGDDMTLRALGETLTLTKVGARVPFHRVELGDPVPQGFVGGATAYDYELANTRPSLEITSPSGAVLHAWGQEIEFACEVTDRGEAAAHEMHVIRWERRAVGSFGWTQFGASLPSAAHRERVAWIPTDGGSYEIRATAVDLGGLTASDAITIQVGSRPPLTPEILLPAEGTELYVGAPVLFQGLAYDPDEGYLPDDRLSWVYRYVNPPSAWGPMGANSTGPLVPSFVFPRAGTIEVQLTAVDEDGQAASAGRTFQVAPAVGNSPPLVVIQYPGPTDPHSAHGGKSTTYTARASDVEDDQADLVLEWTVAFEGEAQTVIGAGLSITWPVPDTHPQEARAFTLTARATDTGGLSSQQAIPMILWGSQKTIE